MGNSTQSKLRSTLVPTAAFVVLYFAARVLLKGTHLDTWLRVVVALAPVPAFAIFLMSVVRGLQKLDELERRIQLEALAIAYPLAILLLMTLGLLQLAVPLSPDDWSYRHVWAYLPLFYYLGLIYARRRYQ